ncbi:MAG TPA: type II/IV secretion system protein [Candidatus Saccharimonadales bacterium]|nr:type II/IV secretion system protein [Candidatus Saccharimonadales bacterium]
MYPSIDVIKAILLRENYVSEADSKAAEAAAHNSSEYVEYLIRAEVLSKSLLGQALAESYHMPYADLEINPATKEQVNQIPEQTGKTQHIVLLHADNDAVTIATDRPDTLDKTALAAAFPHKRVQLAYTLPEFITAALQLYEQPLETRFSKILSTSQRVAPEIVDEIIKDALGFRASDIHFEPRDKTVVVRFRVDGSLRQAGTVPKEYYDNILNRIKVESGMRIDEHLAAQDGAMQRAVAGYQVDLRVSLVPTVEGEKVVMRVLGAYVQSFTFADVGLEDAHRDIIERSIAKPFGMILTVGPTGSGKTTTLYSLLKMLNRPNVNITTIEDPVEYKVAGINQIQVSEAGNMTFAKGLRSIVRQDPDIILVGEIRDQETAEISVNAALTGHLLLSTFHANDAATALPRLVDMGIEPFLLASTLEVIIAQRLVRVICSHCRYSLSIGEAVANLHTAGFSPSDYFGPTDHVYAGKGCNVCSGSGYQGRTAVFEIIEITPAMQELLLNSPSTQEIEQLARKQGSRPMFEDGIAKVKRGMTTLSEVLRVVPLPEKERHSRA